MLCADPSVSDNNGYHSIEVALGIPEIRQKLTVLRDLQPVMERIKEAESEGNPRAKNPNSSAKGLYQIIDGTWAEFECTGEPYDPEDNERCAYKIALNSGVHHWNASRHKWDR